MYLTEGLSLFVDLNFSSGLTKLLVTCSHYFFNHLVSSAGTELLPILVRVAMLVLRLVNPFHLILNRHRSLPASIAR